MGCNKLAQVGTLRRDRNFWQYIHSADLGRYSEILARPLFHSQDTGMAAHPALLPGGKLGRKDKNQLQVRALYYPRLGIEEHSACAHISSLGAEFGILAASYEHGQAGNHSVAGASIDLGIHLFLILIFNVGERLKVRKRMTPAESFSFLLASYSIE
jgi:hypothetical protein